MKTKARNGYQRAVVPRADVNRSTKPTKTDRLPTPISLRESDDRPQHTTVLPDLRPPAPPPKQPRTMEQRLFSGSKMSRILGQYQINFEEFVADYDRMPRSIELFKPLEEIEQIAVDEFLTHQDVRRLARELEITTSQAYHLCTRYLIWAYSEENEHDDVQDEDDEVYEDEEQPAMML